MSLKSRHGLDKVLVLRHTKSAEFKNDTETPLEPGKIYVTRLPGRSRPVFIRKPLKKRTFKDDYGLLVREKGSSDVKVKRAQSVPQAKQDHQDNEQRPQTSAAQVVADPNPPPLQVEFQKPPQPTSTPLPPNVSYAGFPIFVRPSQPEAPPSHPTHPPSPTKDTNKHHRTESIVSIYRCVSCGKSRSAGYHHRHPLEPGKEPAQGFCRKCENKFTSSEESGESEREKHPRRKKSGVQGSHNSKSPGKGENKSDEKADGPRRSDFPSVESDEEYIPEPLRPYVRSRQPPHPAIRRFYIITSQIQASSDETAGANRRARSPSPTAPRTRAPSPPRYDSRADRATAKPLYRHVPPRAPSPAQQRDERSSTNSWHSQEREVTESLARTQLEPARRSKASRRSKRGPRDEEDGWGGGASRVPGMWDDV